VSSALSADVLVARFTGTSATGMEIIASAILTPKACRAAGESQTFSRTIRWVTPLQARSLHLPAVLGYSAECEKDYSVKNQFWERRPRLKAPTSSSQWRPASPV